MERAASSVKAKVFVIVATYDHVVTPEPARKFAALLHAPDFGAELGLRTFGAEL